PRARVIAIDAVAPTRVTLRAAVDTLRAGGVVALPTETFYGLAVPALDAGSVRRLFELKGRPDSKPLLILVDSVAMAETVACSTAAPHPAGNRRRSSISPSTLRECCVRARWPCAISTRAAARSRRPGRALDESDRSDPGRRPKRTDGWAPQGVDRAGRKVDHRARRRRAHSGGRRRADRDQYSRFLRVSRAPDGRRCLSGSPLARW